MSKKHKKHPSEMSEEPFLLSPEFEKSTGWGKNFADWWQRYFKSVILPAIIVILIAGGIYAYTSRQQEPTENGELSQTTSEQNGDNLDINEDTIKNSDIQNNTDNNNDTLALGESEDQNTNEPEPSLITPEPVSGGEKITQKAVKGDGLTHIARRALKDYIAQNQPDLKLSAEQKIYCEDYIQKNTKKDIRQKSLSIGQKVDFNSALMDNAIAKAQQLSDKQLQNLSKYVPLVPSLST